jgi:hypothetical protein
MELTTWLCYLIIQTIFLLTLSNQGVDVNKTPAFIPINVKQNESSYRDSAEIPVKVKLLPYQVLAARSRSYADILVTITNTSEKPREIEISQIAVLLTDSQQIIMNSTSQELGITNRIIFMPPGENRVLEYRLMSEGQLYRIGQEVMALIYYKQDGEPERVIQSNSEGVIFRTH